MLKVLGRDNSANVQKVLWTCEELGLPFVREEYGGVFGKVKDSAYLALNPNATVPTLIDGDFALWESNAIVRYLGRRYGNGRLMPADVRAQGLIDQWMDWQQTTLQPCLLPVFRGLIRTKPEDRDMTAIRQGRDKLAAHMEILDRHLKGRAFVCGDEFTAADISLGSSVYRWFEMPIEREDYPSLKSLYERLRPRPGFQKHVAVGMS